MRRVKPMLMHFINELWTYRKPSFDEGLVDDEPGVCVIDNALLPVGDHPLQRLKIPLDSINAHRDKVNEVEFLRVFGKHWLEVTLESHVVADRYTVADRHRQPEG